MKTARPAAAVLLGLALVPSLPSLVRAGTVCDAAPLDIPFGAVEIPVNVTSTGWIQELRIYVAIDHPRVGDLFVQVFKDFGSGNVTAVAFLRPGLAGNPCTGDDVNAFFRDDAAAPAQTSCSNQTGLTMGPYRPRDPFSTFFGRPVTGEWILLVGDFEPDEQGQYLTWCLIWDELDVLFADGFESGNTSAWSSVVP